MIPVPGVWANTASLQIHYQISAGSLDSVLNALALKAGIEISVDGQLTKNKQSIGLHGDYPLSQALQIILAPQQLQAEQVSDKRYLIKPITNTAQLPDAVVYGQQRILEASEETGRYTVSQTSTSTQLAMPLRETPQSISVMTHQRIEDQTLNNVESVLREAPGIAIQNIGTDRYSIYSRGYNIDSFQLDGLTTFSDIVSQNVPQGLSDMAIYDRVEVLRGAPGLLAGAGDPSGVVNLIRKKPTDYFKAHIDVGLGSWNQYRTEVDISGPLTENGQVRGRMVTAHQQGDSYIKYMQTEKQVVYGILDIDITDFTLLTIGADYQRNNPKGSTGSGLPLFYNSGEQIEYSRSKNAGARWNTNKIEASNSFLNLQQQLNDRWTLHMAVNHMEGKRSGESADASWGYPDKATGDGVKFYGGISSARQRQTSYDVHTQGTFDLLGREHEFVLGYNASSYNNFHEPIDTDIEGRPVNLNDWNNYTEKPAILGGKIFDYDLAVREKGVYSVLRLKPTDRLAVIIGARSSNYKYRLSRIYTDPAFARFDSVQKVKDKNTITPYAGVVYELNDLHSLYASFTSIYKPQTYRERSGAFLAPREGENYELGIKSELFSGQLNTSFAIYQVKQNNLAVVDQGVLVAGADKEKAYKAVKGAKTKGFDLELNGELAPNWNLAFSYTYGKTQDAKGERIKTLMPEHIAKLWTTYRLSGDWHKLTVGAGVNWQSEIHFTATPWDLGKTVKAKQGSYALVNAMARYDVTPRLQLTANINNLFDKKYLSSLDETFYTGFYGAPRNYMLNLRYSF